jgi:TRAP-type C4-dicarboxylate transport system permease small subunit
MEGTLRYAPMRGGKALRPLAHAIATLDFAVGWSLVVMVAVMVTVVSAQVALRYLFNSSIDWADELSRLCFVWSIFLAIPLGLKGGGHIGIEMLATRLPPSLQNVVVRLVAAVGACLLMLVAWESAVMAWDQWDELMASMPASAGWFLVPLAVSGVHGAMHLLWQAATGEKHVDTGLQAE